MARSAGVVAGEVARSAGGVAGEVARSAGGVAGEVARSAGGVAGEVARSAGGVAGEVARSAGGVAGGASRPRFKPSSANVKEFDPTTALVLAAAMGAEGELVAARMARGCRCFGAWLGDELVGYSWLSTRPEWIGELEMEIAPARGEAYIWNCVTLDPHRRKGVFGALVASLVERARKEGLARVWIATLAGLADNAVVRAGFVRVIRFDTASGLGLRWLTIVPVDGVDPVLKAAALEVIAIKPGSSVRRSRRRRH